MAGTNNLGYQDFYSTTLAQAVVASDTTIYLNTLPTPNEGYLVIEPDSTTNREIIFYNAKGANYVTVPSSGGRGVGGTTAISHSSGVAVQMNNVAELWTDLQGGNSLTGLHQWFNDSFSDYTVSGGAITQATGLIASVSSGVAYINGRRLPFNAFNKTLTASKDTYFDLYATDGSNIATVSYTELASGATGSTPVSNGMHIGMVRSNASLLATVYQTGYDTLNNPLKPVIPNQALPAGSVVQYVYSQDGALSTTTTAIPFDDTIPQNTEGAQFLSKTITPKSATNLLEINIVALLGCNPADRAIMALFQDSTANALAATSTYISTAGGEASVRLKYVMVAGTTSPTTFKMRAGESAGATLTFNGAGGARKFGGVAASIISITEYQT